MSINSGNGFKHYRRVGKQSPRSVLSRSASADCQTPHFCGIYLIRWWVPSNGPMTARTTKADENLQGRFCALEYRPQGWSKSSPQAASIIVLVLEDEQGNLRFLV